MRSRRTRVRFPPPPRRRGRRNSWSAGMRGPVRGMQDTRRTQHCVPAGPWASGRHVRPSPEADRRTICQVRSGEPGRPPPWCRRASPPEGNRPRRGGAPGPMAACPPETPARRGRTIHGGGAGRRGQSPSRPAAPVRSMAPTLGRVVRSPSRGCDAWLTARTPSGGCVGSSSVRGPASVEGPVLPPIGRCLDLVGELLTATKRRIPRGVDSVQDLTLAAGDGRLRIEQKEFSEQISSFVAVRDCSSLAVADRQCPINTLSDQDLWLTAHLSRPMLPGSWIPSTKRSWRRCCGTAAAVLSTTSWPVGGDAVGAAGRYTCGRLQPRRAGRKEKARASSSSRVATGARPVARPALRSTATTPVTWCGPGWPVARVSTSRWRSTPPCS